MAGILMFLLAAASSQATPDSLMARAVADGHWAAVFDSSAGTVNPGPLFRFRRVEVLEEGGGRLEGPWLRGFGGERASRENLEALQGQVRRYLLNQGFPFAVIRSRALPVDSDAVDAEIRVHSGSAYKLGEARPLETRTHADVARRLALWKIGEPFSEERLERGMGRLRRTGYFEYPEFSGLFRDSARNLLYPVLRLPDFPGNRLSGLFGYDSKAVGGQRLTGFADLHLINVFGTARDLDFILDNRPGNERRARLAYVEPWIWRLPVGVRLELDFLQQDTVFWEWNRDLIFFQDLNFSSRLEIQLGDQENNGGAAGTRTRAVRSGLHLSFDHRDRAPLTSRGYRLRAGLLGMRRRNADSLYYLVQSAAELETWIPATQLLEIHAAFQAATNIPLDRFNRGELHEVGGTRSLRGYREREFLTNAYGLGRLEAQTRIGRRGRVFLFGDPGAVNRLVDRYDWRYVLGYGAGMEISRGAWGLSLSFALNPDRAPGDGLLHVGLDNRF